MIFESDYRRRAMAQWKQERQQELEQLRSDMQVTSRRWTSLLDSVRRTACLILRIGDRRI
ncbi:hypothetical protein M6D81_20115 [Paenibacillus sp. J5C_2022]|uniref:hypothetical protein n=1 Tax=Paenibacillus sp. J5C2022 TaxID=2977129 RepID=UPI0021D31BF1|nr:hypothetical protein [Paenibacillus sp. J5C2022]MCU6711006.1 hypothetical protein [Paenibacillus sp. J5C2022]